MPTDDLFAGAAAIPPQPAPPAGSPPEPSDDATAQQLTARGIDVIQDRCMLSDHRSLL